MKENTISRTLTTTTAVVTKAIVENDEAKLVVEEVSFYGKLTGNDILKMTKALSVKDVTVHHTTYRWNLSDIMHLAEIVE